MNRPGPVERTTSTLQDGLLDLFDLLERTLEEEGTEEARALRRAMAGRPRPQDEAVLGPRVEGARICLLTDTRLSARVLEAEAPSAVTVASGNDLLLLLAEHPRPAGTTATEQVSRVVGRLLRSTPTGRAGISTALHSVAHAPRALDEAQRAVGLAAPGQVLAAENCWASIALSRMRDSLHDSLTIDGPLSALEERPELRESLATWFESDGDVRAAAKQLHLHPNTLRYRLRRAAQMTGLSLDDPLERIVLHVALISSGAVSAP